MKTFKTPSEVALKFGCTELQARKQIERCRDGISGMLAKAAATGRKINGYGETELKQIVDGYNRALGKNF